VNRGELLAQLDELQGLLNAAFTDADRVVADRDTVVDDARQEQIHVALFGAARSGSGRGCEQGVPWSYAPAVDDDDMRVNRIVESIRFLPELGQLGEGQLAGQRQREKQTTNGP